MDEKNMLLNDGKGGMVRNVLERGTVLQQMRRCFVHVVEELIGTPCLLEHVVGQVEVLAGSLVQSRLPHKILTVGIHTALEEQAQRPSAVEARGQVDGP